MKHPFYTFMSCETTYGQAYITSKYTCLFPCSLNCISIVIHYTRSIGIPHIHGVGDIVYTLG